MDRPGALAAIGNTPLVELQHLSPDHGARILVKLEYLNPTGAIKDRLALAMIEGAEGDRRIGPGTVIVEYTGGSTGPGLALVGAVKGYRVKIVTSSCFSEQPRQLMRALGADVEVLPALVGPGIVTPGDIDGMVKRAGEYAELPNHHFTDQFRSPYIIPGLREGLGREILDRLGGSVTAYCAGVGSGATLLGPAEVLRQANPAIRIVALEPAGSPVLSGGARGPFKIQGWSGFVPPLYRPELVDAIETITDEQAMSTTLRLARDEGIFTGVSGGANVAGAVRIAASLGPDDIVVTVVPDSGYKYLAAEPYLQATT